jgi:4-hydroxybutyrate dehydrogenase/sulfolactaldehyde 3-reductase
MARIAFVGLGQMGGPMSRNLLKAGHELRVFDLDPRAVAAVAAAGAAPAPTAREAAIGAEFAFTILPVGQIVEEAVLGPEGLAHGLGESALLVDMSTILPEETRRVGQRLRERGVAMVDAPVGRTSAHAVTGTSTFMVGGDAADVERARPLLLSMGEAVTHCGPLGAGATVKLANNYISAVVNMATAEGLTLGLAAGIELDKMVEVISQTPAGQGHIRTTWPQKALVDDPTPAFMLDLAHKDLGLALDTAARLRVPLATGAAARQFYAIAQAQGRGRDDWTTGIFRTLKSLIGR